MGMVGSVPRRGLVKGTKHGSDHLDVLRNGYLLLVLELTDAPLEAHLLPVVVTVPVG